MHQGKKNKILLGLFYLSILISFLFILFSNFDLEEISTYQFIQKNKLSKDKKRILKSFEDNLKIKNSLLRRL